nr:reverse transcriptase domain-containing protein [Tanacetum cinerariifolium]
MTTPATVNAVEETCVICGGAHLYYECIATDSNILSVYVTTGTYNQGSTRFRPQVTTNYHASPPSFPPVQNNQNHFNQNQNQSYNQNRGNKYQALIQHPQVELMNDFSKYKQITETSIRAMQNQIDNFKAGLKNKIHSLMQNQMNNVKNKLKSDINELRNMMDGYFQKDNSSTLGLGSLPSNTITNTIGDLKAITTRSGVSYDGPPIPPHTFSLPKVVERVSEVTKDMVQPTITFKVGQTSKYSYNNAESINRIDIIDVACEEYVQEVLGFFDNSKCGSPTPVSDPIISSFSTSFTPFDGSDFILEEIETFLQIPDGLSDLDDDHYDTDRDILYLEKLLNEDPSPNLPSVKSKDPKQVDATMTKPSIGES